MVMAGCLYQIHRCRQGVWFRHGADSVFMTGLCRRARHSKNRGAFCSQELVHGFRHPVRTASYPVMLVIVFFTSQWRINSPARSQDISAVTWRMSNR